ncbi:MAG TPA: gamma-glutamyl-gamma-aminobutyrate hydrolase family protein [Roseiflexaceae bacterium]|nr:gamma-glutamyl-gamma-aminobutyrate hydrolase family protein [Roseiflexaceae bacterium]
MGRTPSRRPIIGIPCSAYPDSWYTPANGNAISYLRAIEAAGGVPALIHLTSDAEVLDAHYRRCDALLLAGGEDVHPSFYGVEPHPKLGKPNPFQDEVELALARRAAADGMPILGVCRGVQLLNVALGGTLYQDIPAEVTGALDHEESTRQREMAHLAHPIALEGDSWLAAQLDADELTVNSLHHQALREVAPGLRVVARAPDSVVEAVEGIGSSFVVGVQCHPEELWERADGRWARVFAGFVAAAQAR